MKQVETLIREYLKKTHEKINDPRLIDENIIQDISTKITNASKIVNLSSSDLLKNIDFQENNLTIEKIEGLLAELRAIFWLDNFRFSNIKPLKAKNRQKTQEPDFEAIYKKKKAVIEVYCLTEKHEQQKDKTINCYVNTGNDFLSKYKNKVLDKKSQLDSINSDIKIFLCVINSKPVSRLNTKNDFQKYLEQISVDLSWGSNYYFGVLTGLVSNGISDDTIYPLLH